jgi:hypothetical protein
VPHASRNGDYKKRRIRMFNTDEDEDKDGGDKNQDDDENQDDANRGGQLLLRRGT